MRGFVAVLQREVIERRMLLLVAGLAGLISLLVPYLPGTSPQAVEDIRGATALVLSFVVSVVLSVILGGSVISQDLAERRLSFYFSRPVSGPAIWAGKMTGAVLLVFCSTALVFLPALLAGSRFYSSLFGNVVPGRDPAGSVFLIQLAVGLGLLVPFLLLAAHAVSVMLRARSVWLLFDLIALGTVAALVQIAEGKLRFQGALTPAFHIVEAVLVTTFLVLLAASLVQVVRSRTDLRKSHRWLSVTLWSPLLVFGLASQGYAHWVLDISPEDLDEISFVQSAPVGDWVLLGGKAKHRGELRPMFLWNTSSGRSVFLRDTYHVLEPQIWPEISANGRRAAWLALLQNRSISQFELRTLDLTQPNAVPVATPIAFPSIEIGRLKDIALSPDGSRLASLERARLLVYEISTGRPLVSLALPPQAISRNQRIQFLAPDLIRLYVLYLDSKGITTTNIYEANLKARKLTQTGGSRRALWLQGTVEEDHERIPIRNLNRGLLNILDGKTGEVLTTLPASRLPWAMSAPLTRGRFAVPSGRKGSWDLNIFAQDGSELRRFHFDGVHNLQAGPQPDPDHLFVVSWTGQEPEDGQRLWLLDLESGSSKLLGEDLVPAARSSSPGSPGSKLFRQGDQLVRLDPLRGEKRVVLDLGRD